MRSTQALSRNLIFMLLFATPLPTFAEETGWITFPDRCHAELKPDWLLQSETGKKWEADSLENLSRLEEMTNKICPNYFKHPNDTIAIQAFNDSKKIILDHSPLVEKNGLSLLTFLKSGLQDYQSTFTAVELDFSLTPCGKHMRSTQERVASRLATIKKRVNALAKSCFGVAEQEAASNVSAHVTGRRGNSGPAPTKRAPSESTLHKGSDITGIREDKAKSLK